MGAIEIETTSEAHVAQYPPASTAKRGMSGTIGEASTTSLDPADVLTGKWDKEFLDDFLGRRSRQR
jgi:hypothetical protein